MSDDKRKRSANWLPSEKELLLNLIEQYFNIIENKKTDGVTMKSKLAQWQIISDQYNSQTTHSFRTADNLKAQWESMKKVARKDAANTRKHMIQTGGGSSMPPKKDDHIHQRVLGLITTSAVGLFNPFDSDAVFPVAQDQAASLVDVHTDNNLEPPPAQYKDSSLPVIVIENEGTSDIEMDDLCVPQEVVTKDWGNYTPQLLKTPVSQALKVDNAKEKEQKQKSTNQTWVSRRRPVHTPKSSSLEQLHKKKIEAIEFQKNLAVLEMEKTNAIQDLEIQIKKEMLKQQKIKTNILSIRRRKLSTIVRKAKH